MSDAALPIAEPARSARRSRAALLVGQVFEGLCFAAATTLLLALGGIIASLVIGGWPAPSPDSGSASCFPATWNPVSRRLRQAAGPVVGTLVTAVPSPSHFRCP